MGVLIFLINNIIFKLRCLESILHYVVLELTGAISCQPGVELHMDKLACLKRSIYILSTITHMVTGMYTVFVCCDVPMSNTR